MIPCRCALELLRQSIKLVTPRSRPRRIKHFENSQVQPKAYVLATMLSLLATLMGCSDRSAERADSEFDNYNGTTPKATAVATRGEQDSDIAANTVRQQIGTETTKSGLPNILFILTDDQRRDTIRALGNNEIVTPNLDQLVARGVSFSQASIMGAMNGSVGTPSRAMVMTGRSVFELEPSGRTIAEQYITLPQALKEQGYYTFHTGKWSNGKQAFARSFSHAENIFFGAKSDHYNIPLHDFDPQGRYADSVAPKTSRVHSTVLYSSTAQKFLRTYDRPEPFFLSLSFQAPHDPRQIAKSERFGYAASELSLGESFRGEHGFDNGELDVQDEWTAGVPRDKREVQNHLALYYEMITQIDRELGKILQALNDTGRLTNTLIVFTSDNGLALGRHGLMGKQSLYEHSVGVPLIFAGPTLPKAKKLNEPVFLSSIYPTIIELLGLNKIASVTSSSFYPSLISSPTHQDTVPLQATPRIHAYKNFQRALVSWPYKLMAYNVEQKPRYQLFNLIEDPEEVTDLLQQSSTPQLEDLKDALILQMQELLVAQGDAVDFNEPQWKLPRIDSWVDYMRATNPEELSTLRRVAEQERLRF